MDIKKLKQILTEWAEKLKRGDRRILKTRLLSLKSAFPFNEYEYRLMFLSDKKIISFKEYEKLRRNYVSKNPYLELYGIAPRIFGEIWGHQHLLDLDNRFKKANKSIDPTYDGSYDLLVNKVKVEVKASRAINTKIRGKIEDKALSSASKEPFWMNFQQIKLDVADVFVFIGVWVDKICYWVLSNKEAKTHPLLSRQHRGGIEYQIGITEKNLKDFNKYLVKKPSQLVKVILRKGG